MFTPMQRSEVPNAPTGESIQYREVYQVPEVAVLLGGASERWVWSLVDRKVLPSVKIGGKRLIPRADLIAFIEGLREDERTAREAAGA